MNSELIRKIVVCLFTPGVEAFFWRYRNAYWTRITVIVLLAIYTYFRHEDVFVSLILSVGSELLLVDAFTDRDFPPAKIVRTSLFRYVEQDNDYRVKALFLVFNISLVVLSICAIFLWSKT